MRYFWVSTGLKQVLDLKEQGSSPNNKQALEEKISKAENSNNNNQ